MTHRTGCLICGADIVYLEESRPLSCHFCGTTAMAHTRCANGHHVCDVCHRASAYDVIEQYCITAHSTNPVALALTLMRHPSLNMHGPEHHFLVPAVLLAAYCKRKELSREERAAMIGTARLRSEDVKGGFCGLHGACGAGIGTGIFVSVITGATPLSNRERGLSNRVTAECLLAIAKTEWARCCKRDTLLAILTAVGFLEKEFGIRLTVEKDIRCTFSELNRECLGEACPFHRQESPRPQQARG